LVLLQEYSTMNHSWYCLLSKYLKTWIIYKNYNFSVHFTRVSNLVNIREVERQGVSRNSALNMNCTARWSIDLWNYIMRRFIIYIPWNLLSEHASYQLHTALSASRVHNVGILWPVIYFFILHFQNVLFFLQNRCKYNACSFLRLWAYASSMKCIIN